MKKVLLKIAGRDNLQVAEGIELSYILRLCWKYGWMLVRGFFFALGKKKIEFPIFIGKKVKILQKNHIKVGKKTKIHDDVKIDALSKEGVSIGENCVLGRNTVIECTGSLENLGVGLIIGDRTTFSNDCFFGSAGGIKIGSDVVAGQFIRFHSENHMYDDLNKLIKDQGTVRKGIIVGNNCWIGSGAVFLDGVEIGDGCVVAANSVVTKSFSDNSVIAGVPAKVIKIRE